MILPEAQPAQRRQCSAKGCRHEATYALVWRNPRIHDGDRRKTWLACEEHVQSCAGCAARLRCSMAAAR